jgi:hypothetical protein
LWLGNDAEIHVETDGHWGLLAVGLVRPWDPAASQAAEPALAGGDYTCRVVTRI